MIKELSIETIRAAQSGNAGSTETVLRGMESRFEAVASAQVRHMAMGADYVEELMQVGRIAVWEALTNQRWTGETVDEFYAFATRTASSAMKETASADAHPGVDRDARKIYSTWVTKCDGDLALAERMCQTVPPEGGRRLGRDRAHAARLAWQTVDSLDAPPSGNSNDADSETYADLLASALGIPGEFITAADLSAEERRQTVETVRAILDVMGPQTADVLRGSYGIQPMPFFGFTRGENHDPELAEHLGMTEKQVKTGRAKGMLAFAKRYVPLVSNGIEAIAAGWWDAFQAERDRSKRLPQELAA